MGDWRNRSGGVEGLFGFVFNLLEEAGCTLVGDNGAGRNLEGVGISTQVVLSSYMFPQCAWIKKICGYFISLIIH
jgi:hypothetical protein